MAEHGLTVDAARIDQRLTHSKLAVQAYVNWCHYSGN